MSSTVAYDPDEFDNNPFAEPVAQSQPSHPNLEEEPIGEPQQSTGPQSTNTAPKEDESSEVPTEHFVWERYDSKHDYKIVIKVHGLERSGSLTNKKENPAVSFDLSTNLPIFRKKSYKNLKKSYEEFQQFFKYLNGANPECFIPAIPQPFTHYGIQNEEDYKKTIRGFHIWFQRVTSNPILVRNEEFAYFVDSDFNNYTPVNKSKVPASGLKRKTLKQFQPPYDEALELAEFRPLIKSLYQNSKSIVEKLEKLSKLRKILAVSENELGSKVEELKELENNHPGMSNMWRKFGKTMSSIGDLDSIIGTLDIATFGDGLGGIMNDGYVIKESLTNRHLLMRELISLQSHTKVKHENARKLRSKRDINPIKVDLAIKELQEAIDEEDALSKKIKRITEEMLIERQEYLEHLNESIKQIFVEFVARKIEYERRKLITYERIRADIRAVDANGGLSRLGRENYPKKDSFNATSQNTSGDDWSGDRKVSHFSKDILEFSKSDNNDDVTTMQQNAKPLETSQEEDAPINARDAASLLGGSTF